MYTRDINKCISVTLLFRMQVIQNSFSYFKGITAQDLNIALIQNLYLNSSYAPLFFFFTCLTHCSLPTVPMHNMIKPLAWLLGRWRADIGRGKYPTISDFQYGEEIEFFHVGQPNIQFRSVKYIPYNTEFLRKQCCILIHIISISTSNKYKFKLLKVVNQIDRCMNIVYYILNIKNVYIYYKY